jgi:hypothetical protein
MCAQAPVENSNVEFLHFNVDGFEMACRPVGELLLKLPNLLPRGRQHVCQPGYESSRFIAMSEGEWWFRPCSYATL